MNDIFFMLTLLFANTMQTITGFAGNLIAMPLSIKLEGYDSARAVVNIFTLLACAYIAVRNIKYINFKELFKMSILMIFGMAVGNLLLNIFKTDFLAYIYGMLIMVIAIKKLFWSREIMVPDWGMLILLVAAGIIHGLFLSGGALAVVYAVSKIKDKDEFRATIAPLWVILDLIQIFFHLREGLYTNHVLFLIVLSVIPMIISITLGNIIYSHINKKVFLKITYILLLFSAAIMFL